MNRINGIIQVNSVTPGTIGGAVFSGRIVGERRIWVCVASNKVITRPPKPGECWRVSGRISDSDKHRSFVTVDHCYIADLPSAAYVERLLIKHPVFRGIYFGKTKIMKLVNEFGSENLVQTLNSGKVSAISEIINPNTARAVVSGWLSLKNEIATVEFLMDHEFDPDLARRIIRICRTNTVDRLKINPYGLVAFQGLHPKLWSTIEATSHKLGIKHDDPRRLVGAVEYVLFGRLSNGHTACSISECSSLIDKLLGSKLFSRSAIQRALDCKAVCVATVEGEKLIQPLGAAIIESQLESRIQNLLLEHLPNSWESSEEISYRINRYEQAVTRVLDYSLTDQQRAGVKMALMKRISIITGFGGTGKTSVLRAVSEIAKAQHRTVRLLALSGKAKEHLRETTGFDAYTIHGFIRAVQHEGCPLSTKGEALLIIDEASMVDTSLMNRLLGLFEGHTYSLLMVGDTGQISPVGFGLFWHKLVKLRAVPTINLTQVHRTSEKGEVHRIAMQIRRGVLPALQTWRGEKEGVYSMPCAPNSKALLAALCEVKSAIPTAQIISPHMSERSADSGKRINDHLQNALCTSFDRPGIKMGLYWLKRGDPVIVTQNSYEHDLYNGNTGVMEDVREEEGQLVGIFSFGYREYILTRPELWDLGMQLAYAVTIHKSQGSEYETTIICSIVQSAFIERSMFYTALTRSKKLCIIVGDQTVARAAVAKKNRSDTLCVGFRL